MWRFMVHMVRHEAKEHEAKAVHEMKEQHNAQVHAIDRAGAGLGQTRDYRKYE